MVRTVEIASKMNGCKSVNVETRGGGNFNENTLRHMCKNADIIVNCTPLGMEGVGEDFTGFGFLVDTNDILYDTIYKPSETTLQKEGKRLGLKCINELPLLVCQGILVFEHITNKKFVMIYTKIHIIC